MKKTKKLCNLQKQGLVKQIKELAEIAMKLKVMNKEYMVINENLLAENKSLKTENKGLKVILTLLEK